MSITERKFGEYNGRDICEYILDNGNGLSACILNYGGIIRKLVFNGTDVVRGFDTFEDYLDNPTYYGAVIGRNSNRIENSEFYIGEKLYKLNANEGRNNLHGGVNGFDKKIWSVEMIDGANPALVLSYVSPDGEEGFPGNVSVNVTYRLTGENALEIRYEGVSDKDTVLNMTNHSYFNLNGHASGSIDGHKLTMHSDFYTPNNSECMPYGEVLKVHGTPFDFNVGTTFGERFGADFEQIKMFGGFDHNYILRDCGYRLAAELCGDITGIKMQVYTDRVGLQLYTSNNADARVCKDGAVYGKHTAVCLETQDIPNNLKYGHFPHSVLKNGEKYDAKTAYLFSV